MADQQAPKQALDLIILGAGIAGMGAAWKAREQGLNFQIVEAGPSAGGVLQSQQNQGHTLDFGANSCATNDTYLKFLEFLGLSDELMIATAASKKRYLWQSTGIASVGGLKDILLAPWLSRGGKWRLFTEPFRKKGPSSEESVAAFLTRRIGAEATAKLVDPIMGGIYAGDISKLSALTVMEKFKAGEQRYGSLLRTMFKNPPKPRKISNLRGGMGAIGKAFERNFEGELKLGTSVVSVQRIDGLWQVETSAGEHIAAKKVVSAMPSYVLASVLKEASCSAHLGELEYAPLRVDYVEVSKGDLPVEGFGILVPSVLGKHLKGMLMGSVAFDGRAPEGKHTLTVFSNATSEQVVLEELEELLGTAEVKVLATKNWSKAIPQYQLGYPSWKQELMDRLPEGLLLCGNYLGKVGVADVLNSGYDLNLRP